MLNSLHAVPSVFSPVDSLPLLGQAFAFQVASSRAQLDQSPHLRRISDQG